MAASCCMLHGTFKANKANAGHFEVLLGIPGMFWSGKYFLPRQDGNVDQTVGFGAFGDPTK